MLGVTLLNSNIRGYMLKLKTILKPIVLLLVAVFFSACDFNGFSVTTSFSKTKNVPEGTIVYFDDIEIGKVSDVEVSEDRLNLKLSLEKSVAETIGSGAAVFLDYRQGVPILEFYDRTNPENNKLENGQSVIGIDSIFQLGAWIVGSSIQQGSSAVTGILESFDGYLQSDDFESDKETIQKQIDSAGEAAKNAAVNIEAELQIIIEQLDQATQDTSKQSGD